MQEEKLHKGSPKQTGYLNLCVTNKVLTKNFVTNNFLPKSIMLGRTEQNLKLKVIEHESDLAG